MIDDIVVNSDQPNIETCTPLTAKDLSGLLYLQVATDDAFDAIEGASRKSPTEFVVHPFDGPALLVTVTPVKE
jgi:hypothetical protein